MLTDPVESTLTRRKTLKLPTSTDITPDALLTPTPMLTETRNVPNTPEPAWQRTELSDAHVVLSQEVCDTLPDPLYAASPMPNPCRVTLAEPVVAWFTRRRELAPAESAEYATLTLPTRCPTLTDPSRLPVTPDPAWHRADVSDSHVVRSQPVWPTITDDVCVPVPRLAPCIVMLVEPLAALFVLLMMLAVAMSTLCALLTLPTRPPVVSSTRRLPSVA